MSRNTDDHQLCRLGQAVIDTEASAVAALSERIDEKFAQACRYMLACEGRVVVTGMGKSGHIGDKIAATLASTGTPAFFVHPGEASHGDLGMITPKDVVLALSNSGETDEILTILPIIKRLGVPLVTLTGNPASRMARAASVNLDVSVEQEACPLGLAPTASTTATLAMGDALAVALLESRGFTEEDFARSHPAGSLGERLKIRVGEVMLTGDKIPKVTNGTTVFDAVSELNRKNLGAVLVVSEKMAVDGIVTDGDVRRFVSGGLDFRKTPVRSVMTGSPVVIDRNTQAVDALSIMQRYEITVLPVVNETGTLEGILHLLQLPA